MAGTSIITPDAAFLQANVLASLWTPEDIVQQLVAEFVLGGSAAASIINHAAPGVNGIEFGSLLSVAVTNAGTGGTAGTYAGISAVGGGGSGATITVVVGSGGSISSATITGRGDNYASTLAFPLTGIPGLTGAVVTPTMFRPTYSGKSMIVGSGAGNTPSGIDTGQMGGEPDQTIVLVCKPPSAGGPIFSRLPFLGFLYGNVAGKMGFYNETSGTTTIPHVAPSSTTDFTCYIGWGSLGAIGRICAGSGGNLGPTIEGTALAPTTRSPTTNLRIGGSGSATEVAFAERLPGILTDAQRLAIYRALRGDGTAAGSPLGVVIA